jgi:hypothetical protein
LAGWQEAAQEDTAMRRRGWLGAVAVLVVVLVAGGVAAWLVLGGGPRSGEVRDEAMRAGRTAASFPAADEDFFHAMDGGVALSAAEIAGRDMWNVWTGGNDRLWDVMTRASFGGFDLLKTLSSYPGMKYGRDNRFAWLGVINEPCFEKATGPDPKRFGLWLDHRAAGCAADPFENAQKYPGGADWRARHDAAGQVVLWRGHRRGRAAAVPESGFRRGGGEEMGSEAVLRRSQLLSLERPGAAVSCRHGLRFLPYRFQPGAAAG